MGFQNTIIKLLTSKDLDLSEYLKTTDADSKYAAKDHNHSGVYAPAVHTHIRSQITDFPSSMPASDVYSWAKQPSKPSYTYSEVGAAAASHTHDTSQITGLDDILTNLNILVEGGYVSGTDTTTISIVCSKIKNIIAAVVCTAETANVIPSTSWIEKIIGNKIYIKTAKIRTDIYWIAIGTG